MRLVLGRLRTLTWRQAVAFGAMVLLGLGVAVAALAGGPEVALALLGLLGAGMSAAALQLRRRLEGLRLDLRKHVTHEAARTGRQVVKRVSSRNIQIADRVDVAQRRVLAVLEEERLAASDRHRELLSSFDRSVDKLAKHWQDQTRETEALLQLYRDFRPRAPMPPLGRWAMNASGLLALMFLVRQQRPKLVLELGSGTSSVWISYALEECGGRLVSIDHAAEFAERTTSMLSLHGLDQVAEVRHAPLQPVRLEGKEFRWYQEDAFAGLSDVAMLVIDGPPGSIGRCARYPALPLLENVLSNRATVILDDANRPDEEEVVKDWVGRRSALVRQPMAVDRQAVLSYSRSSA